MAYLSSLYIRLSDLAWNHETGAESNAIRRSKLWKIPRTINGLQRVEQRMESAALWFWAQSGDPVNAGFGRPEKPHFFDYSYVRCRTFGIMGSITTSPCAA
jgi:hypothetical protein